MKHILLLMSLLIFLFSKKGFVQNLIAVNSGNNASFYQDVSSAFAAAQNGDYIYLPGGTFDISTWDIDKGVHVIGAGHYPDSTTATLPTHLYGNIRIVTGASNGSLSGFYMTGSIQIGTGGSDMDVDFFEIKRLSTGNIFLSHDGSSPSDATYISVKDCVIRGVLDGGNAQNVEISNNFIQAQTRYFNANVVFANNIFFKSGSSNATDRTLVDVDYATFENNIFNNSQYLESSCSGLIFYNNSFKDGVSLSGFVSSGNIFGELLSATFVNQNGSSGFSYSHDYHLSPGSNANGAGRGGTDIGIYGGLSPYKDGAVPRNPHIQSSSIDGATDNAGNLNLDIKVAAQDR